MGWKWQLCTGDMESYRDIILKGIQRYIPQKILSKNPDPEYYHEEVKWLKEKLQ